jgi:hypothetical protein
MSVVIRDKHGNEISAGTNLAVLSAHTRKVLPVKISVSEIAKGKGNLCVLFADGSSCETIFQSYQVLTGWLERKRSWWNIGARYFYNGIEVFEKKVDN